MFLIYKQKIGIEILNSLSNEDFEEYFYGIIDQVFAELFIEKK